MKFGLLGFSQQNALQFRRTETSQGGKTKEIAIDCTDLVILRWFTDFYPSMRKEQIDGKEFAWLAHEKLIDDLPILGIKKQSCIDRMQKLVSFGILEYRLGKSANGRGSFYTFGDKYGMLVQNQKTVTQSETEKNTATVSQGRKEGDIADADVQKAFEAFWEAYPKKIKRTYALQEYLKTNPHGEITQAIMDGLERAKKYDSRFLGEERYIPYPSRWLEDRCWEMKLEAPREGHMTAAEMKRQNPNGYYQDTWDDIDSWDDLLKIRNGGEEKKG